MANPASSPLGTAPLGKLMLRMALPTVILERCKCLGCDVIEIMVHKVLVVIVVVRWLYLGIRMYILSLAITIG